MRSDDSVRAEIEALARRAGAGDGRSLDRLLERVRPLVRRWAGAQVGRADAAEDVAQAALIAAYRGLPSFRFDARFETWLYRLTRRAVADWWRRQHRGSVRGPGSGAALSATARPEDGATREPPDDLDAQRLAAVVRAAFSALPARQREVFDLVDLQEQPAIVVARLLDISEATVRVHLMRARRAIRSRILMEHRALVEDRYGVQLVP